MFTHTGNQLAAVTTTINTTDPARVGEGFVWTTDPATGETHGQITLTTNSTSGTNQTPANPAATWTQSRVDATFYALVCDLAGAPQELINTTTGIVEGHTTQTLYGKRTWHGRCTSPLLFAGQYEDAESGWAYNRFRYYNPTLGAYNAQAPLGLAPQVVLGTRLRRPRSILDGFPRFRVVPRICRANSRQTLWFHASRRTSYSGEGQLQ